MERFRFPYIPLAPALACILCAPLVAQTVTLINPQPPREKVIHPFVRTMLFSVNPEDPALADSVTFRPLEQMTERDREEAAGAESSISEHAGFVGITFNQGTWSYDQVVCPALPNHLFLRFKRNNGTGDVTMFSASVPRGDEGRVRIIPIQLRGYSLFSPAPINQLTMSAFNHIRAEDHPEKAPDWLGTALCYAALAGAHPQPALMPGVPESDKYPMAPEARLKVPVAGGAVLSFTDVAATPKPMQWVMTFDPKGKLVKATHMPADLAQVKVLHFPPVVDKTGVLGPQDAKPTQ
jgi:hypothetical protein